MTTIKLSVSTKSLTIPTDNCPQHLNMRHSSSFGEVMPGDSVEVVPASQGATILQWVRRRFHADEPKVGVATTGVCLSLLDEPRSSSTAIPLDANTMYSVLYDTARGEGQVWVNNWDTGTSLPPISATGKPMDFARIIITDQQACTSHHLLANQNTLMVRTDARSYTAWWIRRAGDAVLIERSKTMSIADGKVGPVVSRVE